MNLIFQKNICYVMKDHRSLRGNFYHRGVCFFRKIRNMNVSVFHEYLHVSVRTTPRSFHKCFCSFAFGWCDKNVPKVAKNCTNVFKIQKYNLETILDSGISMNNANFRINYSDSFLYFCTHHQRCLMSKNMK